MSTAPAWFALALGVVNSGVLAGTGLRRRWLRQAAGPMGDIRAALAEARDGLQHLVAVGGEHTGWFLADERRGLEQRLSDLAARARDTKLTAALAATAASWRESFAHAPPPPGPWIWVAGAPVDPARVAEDLEHARRCGLAAEAARAGLAHVSDGFTRLNVLERRLA